MVLGGDFNCVLEQKDTTGEFNRCAALERTVRGLSLCDSWRARTSDPGFTFHTAVCRSRLDRIYVSQHFKQHIKSVHRHAVSFGNHQAMSVHVNLQVAYIARGPSYWKAARYTFYHPRFLPDFTAKWEEWLQHRRRFPDVADWWEKYGKPRIKSFCQVFAKEYWRARSSMQDHYRQCLEQLYAKPVLTGEQMEECRQLRQQLKQQLSVGMQRVQEHNKTATPVRGEEPSMFTIISTKKKAESSTIKTITDPQGAQHCTQRTVSDAIVAEFTAKFTAPEDPLNIENNILRGIQSTLNDDDRARLTASITMEELKRALRKSPRNKSPGSDGLPAEFYQTTWDVIGEVVLEILNKTVERGRLSDSQQGGILVLLPKTKNPTRLKDYRPLTMLNADYKLLARVITERISMVLPKVLHPMVVQPGGDRNITAALNDLRDAVSYYDLVQQPGCLLSADIAGAFDNVRHDYLYEVLRRMGFGEEYIGIAKIMYEGGWSRVQVNGFLSKRFPVKKSIRQGCPMSAAFFAIVISPFIKYLSSRLVGLTVGEVQFRASAYADDVKAILKDDKDVTTVQEVFQDFQEVSGLAVSPQKTVAIALGTWVPADHPMPYPYVDHSRILGVMFASTVREMSDLSWAKVVAAARAVLEANRHRTLNLVQKVWFAQTYILSKLWYVGQVLPAPKAAMDGLQSSVAGWLWAGRTFRVPFRVMCSPRTEGGLGLLHPYWKATALFMGRWTACSLLTPDSFTAAYLDILTQKWPLRDQQVCKDIPESIVHYKMYHLRRTPDGLQLPDPMTARAVHRTFYQQLMSLDPPGRIRAHELTNRSVEWPIVWKAISRSWHGSATRSAWYYVVHDLERTNARMNVIAPVRFSSPACDVCGQVDTLQHRFTDCGGAADTWAWLVRALGRMSRDTVLRPDRRWQPKELNCTHWWILGKYARYCTEQQRHELSPQGFKTFVHQAYCQLDENDSKRFGRYLDTFITKCGINPSD